MLDTGPLGGPPLNARATDPPTPGGVPAPDGQRPDRAEKDTAEHIPLDVAVALPQILRIVGSVVAPTTLLTALLFYFGRLHANGFFGYFGVNFTVLDLTFQDYLIRSADGLFVPLAVAALAVLLALWAHRLILDALPAGTQRRVVQVLTPLAGLAGSVLVGVAVAEMFWDVPLFLALPEAGGLSLSIGVILLAYAARLSRLLRADPPHHRDGREAMGLAEWGTLFLLVSIGLFWAVGSYATGAGTGRGQQMEFALPGWPDAVLYSEKSLNLRAPGVREVKCENPEAAYRFRYDGLKLVLQSGHQYMFLPAGWTPADGPAVLIPRHDSLRLEFSAAGQARDTRC